MASQIYIGKSVVNSHLEQAKKDFIEEGEEIEGIFHCGIRRSNGGRGLTLHDYLIITNRRIIAWGRGFFSKNVEYFEFDKIVNIQAHKGLLMGEIEINLYGSKEHFKHMVKGDVLIAMQMIQDHVKKTKNNISISNPEERLLKLKNLLEKGLITKSEFETEKKKVLNSI